MDRAGLGDPVLQVALAKAQVDDVTDRVQSVGHLLDVGAIFEAERDDVAPVAPDTYGGERHDS